MKTTEQETPILEPGTVIRPEIDTEEVRRLAERLYGLAVLELTKLNGYDDKNYRVIADPLVKNPLMSHCEYGYVLKIMNTIDSMNREVVEAQNEIMNFLHTCSIVCPKPIRNIYGHLYSVEDIGGKQHAVRLLQYVPGELIREVPKTDALLLQLGEFVANLDNKLQKFNHSGLVNREHIWMLSKVPDLEKFKYVITDEEKLELVEEVIEEFKSTVVPRLEDLDRGVIHGDINEMNIVVGLKPDSTDYQVTGVLDFGDIQYSYYVFEVAIAMTYMILQSGNPRVGGVVLAGYTTTRTLTDDEYGMLKTLISARLVQSLVLGAYTSQQDPSNAYLQSTEKANGWEVLRIVRMECPDGATDWKAIADEYRSRR